jgi:hypothetical protein
VTEDSVVTTESAAKLNLFDSVIWFPLEWRIAAIQVCMEGHIAFNLLHNLFVSRKSGSSGEKTADENDLFHFLIGRARSILESSSRVQAARPNLYRIRRNTLDRPTSRMPNDSHRESCFWDECPDCRPS